MGATSTVAVHTRLDIHELISRYCHFIDHGRDDAWANLFTVDGVFDVKHLRRLEGRDELKKLPGIVREQGKGLFRHQITNVLIDYTHNPKELTVACYGLVTDWGNGGLPLSFVDYHMTLRMSCHWQIAHVSGEMLTSKPVDAMAA